MLNLMKSNLGQEEHPNDNLIEHFYRKNQLEYPKYEYMGHGSFMRTEDSLACIDPLLKTNVSRSRSNIKPLYHVG